MQQFDLRSPFRRGFTLIVVCASLMQAGLATGVAATPTNAAPYFAAVRQFADQVLAHGRDIYGQPTPIFVDGLNVDTREPVKWKWVDDKEWVLCNLANQQGLFRTLDGLTSLTGDPRYRAAALDATRYAFDHLRYGTQNHGGLLGWGGHLAYNATFLTQAETIGQNILKQRIRGGWFVPSQRHVYCRMANDESQALLHLAAAMMGKPEAIPAFTGAEPFFHAEYGDSTGRVYDSADIYGKTR